MEILSIPDIHTLEDALTKASVDKTIWDVASYAVRFWTGPSGDLASHISVNLRHKTFPEISPERILSVFADAGPTVRYLPKNVQPVAFEPTIFDLHLGKLASFDEVGENSSLALSEQVFTQALSRLLSYASPFEPEEIVFPIGNDFLHVDTVQKTTTNGTPQDAEGVYIAFQSGIRLLTQAVYDFLEVAPKVKLLVIPGNHDQLSSVFLSHVVAAWFRNDERVTVDTSPILRKYYRYGTNLLGFTHGKYEKIADLPLIMAREAKASWAETTHHEWHTGHTHALKASEQHGVRLRTIPSLSGTDAWHYRSGYVGSQRAAEGYLWHRKDGYVGHFSAPALGASQREIEGNEREGDKDARNRRMWEQKKLGTRTATIAADNGLGLSQTKEILRQMREKLG